MAETENSFEPFMAISPHLCEQPLLSDELSTPTSQLQRSTIEECLPLLNAINDPSSNPFDFDESGLPMLKRGLHADFVRNGLQQLPAAFVAMDASRPWLMYWSLLSLYLMGEDVKTLRHRIVKTFEPLQNQTGGFGGGQGHMSHLACTYAVILSVAIVGGDEAFSLINRNALWHWLGRLKQTDGGFRVCEDGEEDVRGAYCALVAITLLDLPWDLPSDAPARATGMKDFRDKLGVYFSRCQTYEGGISASPGNEAHGAYVFCALACLCILGQPKQTLNNYLNLEMLVNWLSKRQYAPEGGFAGRTNKVVDGCYSHWIGGCWPLVEAALNGPGTLRSNRIFSAEGLARYILGCCQAPTGGLRDKPSKRPDAYHTCYNLAGLSMAKHSQVYLDRSNKNESILDWISSSTDVFESNFEDEADQDDALDKVAAIQPVYVIPQSAVQGVSQWSKANPVSFGQFDGCR